MRPRGRNRISLYTHIPVSRIPNPAHTNLNSCLTIFMSGACPEGEGVKRVSIHQSRVAELRTSDVDPALTNKIPPLASVLARHKGRAWPFFQPERILTRVEGSQSLWRLSRRRLNCIDRINSPKFHGLQLISMDRYLFCFILMFQA